MRNRLLEQFRARHATLQRNFANGTVSQQEWTDREAAVYLDAFEFENMKFAVTRMKARGEYSLDEFRWFMQQMQAELPTCNHNDYNNNATGNTPLAFREMAYQLLQEGYRRSLVSRDPEPEYELPKRSLLSRILGAIGSI